MKSILIFIFISLSLLSTNIKAESSDAKALIDSDCQKCHDNSIYTRKNSILSDFHSLTKRVAFCENVSNAGWSKKQKDLVIEYLNKEYYHFPLQSR